MQMVESDELEIQIKANELINQEKAAAAAEAAGKKP